MNTKSSSEKKMISLHGWHRPKAKWFTRVMALVVTVSFIFPYLTWAFEADVYPRANNVFPWGGKLVEVPEKTALTLSTHQGTKGLVIHVQDLHCNYEVQDNIAKLIEHLARTQHLALVGIEGASLPVNTTHLSLYPDEKVKAVVGRHFMRQGKISGPEFYASTGKYPVELNGVEKPELYAQSRELVQAFLNDETQGMVYDLREALDGLKASLYPPALQAVDEKKQAFRIGRISSVAYAAYLCAAAQRLHLDLGAYPHLTAYADKRLNVLPVDVNPDLIYAEAEQVDAALRSALAVPAAARELDDFEHRLDVVEKMLNISASPEELKEYRGHPQAFTVGNLVRFVRAQGGGRTEDGWDAELYALDDNLKKVMSFYQLADARSTAFVDNLTAQMQTSQLNQAVLITGGFHTDKVLEALAARGYSYISVRPCLTHEDLVNPYFSLIRNRRSPLEKLLAKNQNIFALAPSFAETRDPKAVLDPAQEASQNAGRRLFFDSLRLDLQNVKLLQAFESLRSRFEHRSEALLAGLKIVLQQSQQAYPYTGQRVALDTNGLEVLPEFGVEAPYRDLPVASLVAPVESLESLATKTLDTVADGNGLGVALVEKKSLAGVRSELAARSPRSNWAASLWTRLGNHLSGVFLPWSAYPRRVTTSFLTLVMVFTPLSALVLSSCDRKHNQTNTVQQSVAATPSTSLPLAGKYLSNGAELKREGSLLLLQGTDTRQESYASVFLNDNQPVSVDLDSQNLRLELNVVANSLEWYLIVHNPDLPGGQGYIYVQPETRQTGKVTYPISQLLKNLGMTGLAPLRFELGVSAYGGRATSSVQMAFDADSSRLVVEGLPPAPGAGAAAVQTAVISPEFPQAEQARVVVQTTGQQVKVAGQNAGEVPWGHASSLPVAVDVDKVNLYLSFSNVRELKGKYFIKLQPGAAESAIDVVHDTENREGERFNLSEILRSAGLHGGQNIKVMIGVVGNGKTPQGALVILEGFKLESVTPATTAHANVARAGGLNAALQAGGLKSMQQALQVKANVADVVKAEGPKIFSHLVHWWGPNGTHWNLFGHNPQKDPKDIAAVYHPLMGNYDASTAAYNRWVVRTQKAMGINGVNVDYYAGTEPQDGAALDSLFDAAEQEGHFSVALMLETRLAKGNSAVLKQQLKNILDKYAVRKAYQRVGGVPVIFTFGLSSTGVSPQAYAQVIKDLESEGYVFLLIGDTTTQPAYDSVTSGEHEWINLGAVGNGNKYGSNVGAWEAWQHLNFVARCRNRKNIFSLASIYPGFNDHGVGGNWGQGKDRILDPDNGRVLEATISAAVEFADRDPWSLVQTWDDHHEATTVEPTLEYGFDRLFSLMVFSARYRGVNSDPTQIIRLTEAYIKEVNHGQVSPEAAAVISRTWTDVPTVQRDITRGLDEFKNRSHPFRGLTGYLVGIWAGAVAVGAQYLNFLVRLQGWGKTSLLLGTGMISLYALFTLGRFFQIAWAVQNAIFRDRVGQAVPLLQRLLTPGFWLAAWPAIARSNWSVEKLGVGALAVLKQQNPRVYDMILLHESYQGGLGAEARGLFVLLPGVAEFVANHPEGLPTPEVELKGLAPVGGALKKLVALAVVAVALTVAPLSSWLWQSIHQIQNGQLFGQSGGQVVATYPVTGAYLSNGAEMEQIGSEVVLKGRDIRQQSYASVFLNNNQGMDVDLDSQNMQVNLKVNRVSHEWYLILHNPNLPGGKGYVSLQADTRRTGEVSLDASKLLRDLGLSGLQTVRLELGVSVSGGRATAEAQLALDPKASHIIVQVPSAGNGVSAPQGQSFSPEFSQEDQARVSVEKNGSQVKVAGLNEGTVSWGHASTEAVSLNLETDELFVSFSRVGDLRGKYFLKVQPGFAENAIYVVRDSQSREGGRFNLSEILKNAGFYGHQNVKVLVGVLGEGQTPQGAYVVLEDFKLETIEGVAAVAAPQKVAVSPEFPPAEQARVDVRKTGTQLRLTGKNEGGVPWGHASSAPVVIDVDKSNFYLSYSSVRELQGQYFIKVEPGAAESAINVVPNSMNPAGGRFNLSEILKNAGLHGLQNVKVMIGVVGNGGTPQGATVLLADFKLEVITSGAAGAAVTRAGAPSAALRAGGIASVQDALQIKADIAERVRNEGPKVFAHMVHWWGPKGAHWNLFGHHPQDDPRDIASVYHPLIGNYDASTVAYNRWMVESSKAMGVNGVNIDYYAGTEPQDGAALDSLFDVAEQEGNFSVALTLETRLAQGNPALLKLHLKNILDKYAVREAYQRVAGVPVIFVFGLASTGISPEAYGQVIRELENEGYVFLLIGDTTTQPAYDNVTSGDYEWINLGVVGRGNQYGSNVGDWEENQYQNFVARTRDRKNIFSIASVYPGFNDHGVGGNWGQGKDRILDPENGRVLEATISLAAKHAHNDLWVEVQTMDDHHESTAVEPTLEFGFDRWFKLMELSARYRGVNSDPAQVLTLTEAYLRDSNNGKIPYEAGRVLNRAWAQAPTVKQNIVQGLREYAGRSHPFRGLTGYLVGVFAGAVTLGLQYLAFSANLQGWGKTSVLLGTGMLSLYALFTLGRFFRIAWAVQNAIFRDQLGRELPFLRRLLTPGFWLAAWPAIARSNWSVEKLSVGAMAVLKQQNPRVYDMVLLHERYQGGLGGEILGLFALLPGVAEFKLDHPDGRLAPAAGSGNRQTAAVAALREVQAQLNPNRFLPGAWRRPGMSLIPFVTLGGLGLLAAVLGLSRPLQVWQGRAEAQKNTLPALKADDFSRFKYARPRKPVDDLQPGWRFFSLVGPLLAQLELTGDANQKTEVKPDGSLVGQAAGGGAVTAQKDVVLSRSEATTNGSGLAGAALRRLGVSRPMTLAMTGVLLIGLIVTVGEVFIAYQVGEFGTSVYLNFFLMSVLDAVTALIAAVGFSSWLNPHSPLFLDLRDRANEIATRNGRGLEAGWDAIFAGLEKRKNQLGQHQVRSDRETIREALARLQAEGLDIGRAEELAQRIYLLDIHMDKINNTQGRLDGALVRHRGIFKVVLPRWSLEEMDRMALGTLLHELIEMEQMERGVPFKAAHAVASKIEKSFLRRSPQTAALIHGFRQQLPAVAERETTHSGLAGAARRSAVGQGNVVEQIGFTYQEEPEARAAQIRLLLGEIDKELAAPGTGQIPNIYSISDIHGEITRFTALVSHMLTDLLGTEVTLDPSKPFRPQLEGLPLKSMKGALQINGDFQDRGPEGVKCRLLAQTLQELAPDRVFISLGNHDLWFVGAAQGYQFPTTKDYNFYGDAVAETWAAIHRHNHPEEANSAMWWAARADEYQRDRNEFEKTHPAALEAQARRGEFLGYQKAYTSHWNDEQQQAWEDLTGNFARIHVSRAYLGLNGVGRTSVIWWQKLHKKLLEGHQARSDAGASAEEIAAWAKAAELAGRILAANQQHLDSTIRKGQWWQRVFEAINTQAYTSPEWWFKDWVTHKGWGDEVFKELNRLGTEPREVTAANYLSSPALQAGARFFLEKADLFRRDPFGGLISHGWFPVEDNGDIVLSYAGKTGFNREIFPILKKMSETLKNPKSTRKQILEVLGIVNDWYADKTTRIRPRDVSYFLTYVGVDKILDNLGVWVWITGHNTLDKLDAALTRGERGNTYKLEIDSMMSEEVGGIGSYLRMGARGMTFFGFDSPGKKSAKDIVEAPVVQKAQGAPGEVVRHEGVPAREFLQNMKTALQKELAGLERVRGLAASQQGAPRPSAAPVAPSAPVEFPVIREMQRLREIMPAGPVLNLPVRGLRFLPVRLIYYGLRSLLFAGDNTAANLNLRAPLQVLSVIFTAGFALLQIAVAAWSAAAGTGAAVDDLSPRFDALRRTLTLPDSLTAQEYNVKQIRFAPLSQKGSLGQRFWRGELLGAYWENGNQADHEQWATLFVPDALLQTMAGEIPQADGTWRTGWARWNYRAQAFLFGAIVSYQSGRYFSAIRWDNWAGRSNLAETAGAEGQLAANLTGGEKAADWFAGVRAKQGICSAEIVNLATQYLGEARALLGQPRDESMALVMQAWQRELDEGAKPSLATLMRVLGSLPGTSLPAGSEAALWRDLVKNKAGISAETTALVLNVTLRRLIGGQEPLGAGAAQRGLEKVPAGGQQEIYVSPIPGVIVRELTASLNTAMEQLRARPEASGLVQRLTMLQQLLAGRLSMTDRPQLKAEVARLATRAAAKMDLGEDLKDAVCAVATDRVQTVVLNGYEFAQPLIYEVSAPEKQVPALAELLQGTLPERILAKTYAGEVEERVKAPWHAWGAMVVGVSSFLPLPAFHRLALRLDPMGYLQSQTAKAKLPENSLAEWLKNSDSPIVQNYLRWAVNPKSLHLEREFIKAVLRAEKKLAARSENGAPEARQDLVYSVALLSAFAKNMRALIPGVRVGTWNTGAGEVLVGKDVFMPGILTLPGAKGAMGVHYDIFKGPDFPAKVDENAFELNRRRLFHSTSQAA
jgi:hypothetical protein